MFRLFLKQKMVWLGLLGIAVAVAIFTFAFMGSTTNPVPKDLPIAMVVEDAGSKTPDNKLINLGKRIEKSLGSMGELPVKWGIEASEEDARQKMDERKYYATIVLPEDLTANVMSLPTEKANIPEVKILINEGMNYTGATASKQMLEGIIMKMNNQVQQMMYAQIGKQTNVITINQAKLLANPIRTEEERMNKVGERSGNGNLPTMLTQTLWLTTFISSMILFVAMRKITHTKPRLSSIAAQLVTGLLFVGVISAVMLTIATSVLNANITDVLSLSVFVFFVGYMFFLLQNALLNWIGFAAAPIFLLLFFFSMPILSLPKEFLPSLTNDLLYSWVPFRFSVDGMRSLLFFDGYHIGTPGSVLGLIGIGSLLVMVASVLKPSKLSVKKQVTVDN
ncbi:YhgE/Pip domain-containing protein [Priestia koreensis]|uniref:YhgE/Pip domain-containing protein n=1 Tax=Priestia koreensis TaxID=284581 RepID=UPI00345A6199